MTAYEQSAKLAETIAAYMAKNGRLSGRPTMAQIRKCWDLSNHPIEWATLNYQIEYAMKHYTSAQLRRQAMELRASALIESSGEAIAA